MNVGIAEVSIERSLRDRRQLVELLLIRYHFLNVVLRINKLEVDGCVEQVKGYSIYFYLDYWGLCFLYPEDICDILIAHHILFEIVQELFFRDKGRKHAYRVNVCPCKMNSQSV